MHSARSRKMAQGPRSRGALPDPGRNLGLGWKPARAPHPPGPNPAQKATWRRWPSDPIRRLSVDIGRSKPAAAAHLRNPSSILFFPFSFFTRAAAGRRLQLGSVRWRRQRLSRRRAARSGHRSRAGDLGSSLSIFPPFFFRARMERRRPMGGRADGGAARRTPRRCARSPRGGRAAI